MMVSNETERKSKRTVFAATEVRNVNADAFGLTKEIGFRTTDIVASLPRLIECILSSTFVYVTIVVGIDVYTQGLCSTDRNS